MNSFDLHLEAKKAKATRKAETEAKHRAKRKSRKHRWIDLHQSVITEKNAGKVESTFDIGFKARRLRRDGKVEILPQEFARILKACEEFIDNPKRFPALFAWGGEGIRNIQCRRNIARVMACSLTNCDLIGGRIGEFTEAGIQPISWDQIQEDYALRFGEYISPKSFGKTLKYIKNAGYIRTERIIVSVDDVEGEIRSAPAYKQFTERFFADLKVVRYPNIAELILATRARLAKKGLSFNWVAFRSIASKVQDIYNASKFDKLANYAESKFPPYVTTPPQIPI